MKQLTWRLILPVSVISFATFTKWWYTLPVDAPDTLYSGFPFPFVGEGWHTSMSLQIFILEFLIDFFIYFLFWFILVFLIHRFLTKLCLHKILTIAIWSIAGLIICGAVFIASFPDNIFYLTRTYEMEVMETGYKPIWQRIERPDYYKYHPEDK